MIKSMTGYGNGECIDCEKKFTVEIRSVNHRYSDFNIKLPRSMSFAEDAIRKTLSRWIARGKVDVFLSVEGLAGDTGQVSVNMEIAKGYYEALTTLSEKFDFHDGVSLSTLASFSDVFKLQRPDEDQDAMQKAIISATEAAAEKFTAMRITEGEQLYTVLCGITDEIEALLKEIEIRAPKIAAEYAGRLEARMKELLGAVPVDENRLLNEVAIYADKVDVHEETARLHSHISQMRQFLQASEPVGRKMDFLMQEMNREANTIGSKTNDLTVARYVIDIKAAIEKLREQVQNVE